MAKEGGKGTNRVASACALANQPLADVLALKERALAAAAEGITIADA